MPISNFLHRFCQRKRLNFGADASSAGHLHSEWDRRLGRCSLAIIVATVAFAFTFHVILPAIFSEYLDRKTEVPLITPLVSLAFTSALIMLSTVHLCSISRRIAKNASLYQLAHGTGGQALAVAVAFAQLSDQIGAIGTVSHALSNHINLLFHNAFSSLRFSSPPFWLGHHHSSAADGVVLLDLLAVVLPMCAAMVMMCSVRVLITSSLIFLIATLFTSASTTTVAFLHNMAKLEVIGHGTAAEAGQNSELTPNASKVLAVEEELFLAFRWLLLAWPCIELLSFLAEECTRPRRAMPCIMRAVSRAQPALALLALVAFFPFIGQHQQQDVHASPSSAATFVVQPLLPLPAIFNSMRLFSARYLMNVGSVCSLWAALLCLFLAPTRLLATLAVDRIAFPFGHKHFAKLAKKGGQPRFAVTFVAFCSTLSILIVPQKWLCRLIPLNCVLRMVLQALLVYMCHFTPSCSDHFLGDGGGGASQKYRRVRRRRAATRRRSVATASAQSPTADWKLGEEQEDEEDEEDFWDGEEAEKSDESEDEAWFRECREREHLLERIWRLTSAEMTAEEQQPKSIDMPLLEMNNKTMKQQQHSYQSIQNGTVGPNHSASSAVHHHNHLAWHLPRQQSQNGAPLTPHQQQQQQQRHNCFRTPCSTATTTTMTVNGRTVHTVPFPGPHVYEADASPGWLEAGGGTAAVTCRVESGTKAAATRDEHSACGAAQRALLLACSAASVCAAAHAALHNASADYLPLLPLLALVSSVSIECAVIVWLCRLRVDYGSTTPTGHHGQSPAEGGKWLPIGAVFSFTLCHRHI